MRCGLVVPLLVVVHGQLQARLVLTGREKQPKPLARVEFSTVASEGSIALGLTALQGVRPYDVNGTLSYAVPNDIRMLLNGNELRGRIAVCDRGEVPLVKKIIALQDAGAVGAILVDDGSCRDLECGRAGSPRIGGFAPNDDPQTWRKVRIPAVLVSQATGARIRRLMPLEARHLPNIGLQYLNLVKEREL